VESVFPDFVIEKADHKGVAYDSFIPVAIGAIQELHQAAERKETALHILQKQNSDLEKKVSTQHEELDALKKQLAAQMQMNQKLETRFEMLEKSLKTIQARKLPAENVASLKSE
jgi:septal ring factor EnvC (AmiA/AmiB activator)